MGFGEERARMTLYVESHLDVTPLLDARSSSFSISDCDHQILIESPHMEMQIVPLKRISIPPDRGRKQFTRIEELAESLKANGFIHPILVTDKPESVGEFLLVAGERRYRAACLAGMTEVPVTFRENLSLIEQKIMELEENICRRDIDWSEESETIRQIDEMKRELDGNWQKKDTAEFVNQTPGHVSLQISMAKKLKANPELKARVKEKPIRVAMKIIEQEEHVAKMTRLQESGQLTITTDLLYGDCRRLIKNLATDSVDMLCTDPPYGVLGMENLREGSSAKMPGHQLMSETHNQTLPQMLELLRELAPELVRVLKPGAHFYVFSAMQYVGAFIEALAPLEFQPPVLVWDRGKPTTPGYGYNYLNRIETIIYGHNPPRTRRLAKNMYNVLSHPEVPSSLRCYPTEKPQSLLRDFIQQSTAPGDLVLDPFAGSASTLKAAKDMGRRGIGFEIDESAWKRSQLVLSGVEDE